ncbi:larval cuticle protein A2B-like [Eriocheir sinensis]|uniref:larval cuticle protein A2B-like n=1 Tax=Eriocheir sinensis TaxID=95602 RepID=UPI0021C86AD0|nr:larval cuticle protein A2B-like [Eriocheir sinensis]
MVCKIGAVVAAAVVVLLGVVVEAVVGDDIYTSPHTHQPHHRHVHIPTPAVYNPPIPYDFGYGVTDPYTGTDHGHVQNSDGQVVSGSYHVLLPDGRRQVVRYTADHVNGYQAQVSYEGVGHQLHHRRR